MDGRERLWHHVSQYTERTYPLYAEKKININSNIYRVSHSKKIKQSLLWRNYHIYNR